MDSSIGPIPAVWTVPSPSLTLFDTRVVQIRALLLGGRIASGGAEGWRRLADKPTVVAGRAGGCAMVFRYGAVVLFGIGPDEERELIASLSVREPLARAETETVELRIDGDRERDPRIEQGVIIVPDDNLQR